MPLQYIFLNIAIICAGAILIIAARTLPRLDGSETRKGAWERWLTSNLPKRLDQFFHLAYIRGLRKARVLALKLDNAVDARLKRVKLEEGKSMGGAKPDLSSIAEEKKEDAA